MRIQQAKVKYRYSLILLKELVITEFKLRYQGSALGYLWTLLRPLFLFVILYIVFVYFLRIGSDQPYWPVQLLLGIVLWNFFAEVTNNGVTSIVNRGDVIRKINFPKYVIVLSSSISALINLGINLMVIVVFMAIAGVPLHWGILVAPIFIVELFILALGLAFLLSAIYVRLRDINYIWEIIMQGLFYASVVIYPIALILSKGQIYAQIVLLNPIAQAIQDTRHYLINSSAPTLYSISDKLYLYLIPIGLVIIFIIGGSVYFRKRSVSFAENV
jgi:ABC-2 type transport system permease protein